MGNIEYQAVHGTVIDLQFRDDLSRLVLATSTNYRPLLFRVLHNLAKLKECGAICWGYEKWSLSRIFIFVEWKGPANSGRPALQLNLLRKLLSEPPHIHDVVFPGSLSALSTSSTMYFRLLMSDATRELPQYTSAPLDDQTWQANLRADGHLFGASFPCECPSPWAKHPHDHEVTDSLVQELPHFEYLTVALTPFTPPMPMAREEEKELTSAEAVFEVGDDWVMV